MAIHHTLRLLTTTYRNEPAHVFTDCLNVLYHINTQTKQPPYITTTQTRKYLNLLQARTQTTTLHKVKAHMNISENEQVDKLVKMGCTLEHRDALATHEHAQPTPYYLQKNGGTQYKTHQIKAASDTLENTFLNMTKSTT